MTLRDFQDAISREAHGLTKAEAIEQGICVDCKKPNALSRCVTDAGRREYYISGMCEECWTKLFSEEEY
jgi:hypothetical protein